MRLKILIPSFSFLFLTHCAHQPTAVSPVSAEEKNKLAAAVSKAVHSRAEQKLGSDFKGVIIESVSDGNAGQVEINYTVLSESGVKGGEQVAQTYKAKASFEHVDGEWKVGKVIPLDQEMEFKKGMTISAKP